jgi:hypothetical protein
MNPGSAQDALIALWVALEVAHSWRRTKGWFDFD